jgi:hypothetical protein
MMKQLSFGWGILLMQGGQGGTGGKIGQGLLFSKKTLD